MVTMNERRTAHLVGLTLGMIFALALMLNAVAYPTSDERITYSGGQDTPTLARQ